MEISGRTALVTGAARRLGRVMAVALADAGADVVVHYRTSADDARNTVAAIEATGQRAVALQADVASARDVARLISDTERAFGRLDILVNSAATFVRRPVLEISEEEWDHVLAVNLKGPFLLSQAAVPLLRTGGGVIVNLNDLSALQPWRSFAHHAVSKAGLLHLTRIFARALAPDIRVNSIAPGTVLPAPAYEGVDDSRKRVLHRAGEPADVVGALLYLIESDFVTGENLVVDGGRMLL
jgi:NAD(P)-dependent dehydrogenase (short-subunit alcohol dehydrogenase family)